MHLAAAVVAVAALLSAAPTKKAPPPSQPAPAATAATPANTRVKVLVLDVKSKDLTASEIETLTSLITAHLARYQQLDVMSSVDIKRLVDLEAQKQTAGCDASSCLGEIADAMGAELVIFGQAGKLGSTIVLTLNVFDAKKNEAVGRQPVEARDLSQLPDLVGPAIDRMVQPLFESLRVGQKIGPSSSKGIEGGVSGGVAAGGAPIRSSSAVALGARAKEVYEQQEMNVCVDEGDRLKWWFCDRHERYTENAFVRRYREATGEHDLDDAIKNRNPSSMVLPGTMVGGGAFLLLAAIPLGYYTYVDKTTIPALSGGVSADGTSDSSGALGAELTIGAVAIGASCAIYGGILLADAMQFSDGELTDHSLKEPEARDAAQRYNNALADKIAREYGSAPVTP